MLLFGDKNLRLSSKSVFNDNLPYPLLYKEGETSW